MAASTPYPASRRTYSMRGRTCGSSSTSRMFFMAPRTNALHGSPGADFYGGADPAQPPQKCWDISNEIGFAEALRERRPLVANGVFQQRNAPQGIRRPSPGGLNHAISPPFQWDGLLVARAMGRTESERTPCAPWMSTPSISAVADGPVWKQA